MLDMMVWVWLGVTALAAFVEAVTMTLVSVWCVAGGGGGGVERRPSHGR